MSDTEIEVAITLVFAYAFFVVMSADEGPWPKPLFVAFIPLLMMIGVVGAGGAVILVVWWIGSLIL